MKQMILVLLVVSGLGLWSSPSQSAMSPLSVNVVPPAQFPPSDFNVTGVRASALWGRHRDVYGLDLGLIGNITDQKSTALSVSGLFNYKKGESNVLGLELAGLTNIHTQKTDVYGLQLAGLANYHSAASTVVGVQLAAANLVGHTDVYGVQAGLYNKANSVYGIQIGLINSAKNLRGIQIGLLNFHHTGLFVVSPILNVGF